MNETFDGYTYRQLQGFTVTDDKLVFYSSNSNNPDYGIVFTYSGSNYSNLDKYEYGKTGHGNGMTYNDSTESVFLVGASNYATLNEYNANTMTLKNTYNENDGYNLKYWAIGYDKYNNYYFGVVNERVHVFNNNFEVLYTIDTPISGVYQDIEYKNGYIYVTSAEFDCPNQWQLFCLHDNYSAIIYVFNAKFNNDGIPSKNFGKLVNRFYISPGIGELEGIAFKQNRALLGFATGQNDATNVYKFYEIDYNQIKNELYYTLKKIYEKDKVLIELTSFVDIKSINGYHISEDKHVVSGADPGRNRPCCLM